MTGGRRSVEMDCPQCGDSASVTLVIGPDPVTGVSKTVVERYWCGGDCVVEDSKILEAIGRP